MSDTYEINIVIDEIVGEPSDNLIKLCEGIVDEINKQAPQLEARLEVWEPASMVPEVPTHASMLENLNVPIPLTNQQKADNLAEDRRQEKAMVERHYGCGHVAIADGDDMVCTNCGKVLP